MRLTYAVLTTTLGWVLGIGTVVMTDGWRHAHERKEVATMLLVEVRDNHKRLTSYADAAARRDKFLIVVAAEPQTSRFEATLPRQGLLPADVLGELHEYYAAIRIVMDEERDFSKQTRLFNVSARAREIAGRLIPRLQAIADSTAWLTFR